MNDDNEGGGPIVRKDSTTTAHLQKALTTAQLQRALAQAQDRHAPQSQSTVPATSPGNMPPASTNK
jgi:hypothetical protein